MKQLLLMRHAKSSLDPHVKDHDRPLNAIGLKTAPRMAQLLRKKNLLPEIIYSSTAMRAQQTAELIVGQWQKPPAIETSALLYNSSSDEYLRLIADAPPAVSCLLIVGHNPTLEDLTRKMTGEHHSILTSTIVHMELDIQDWTTAGKNGSAILKSIWRPKETI